MRNTMTLEIQNIAVKFVLAAILALVLAAVVFAPPAVADNHEKAASKPPPLTLEQIKAVIGKNEAAVIQLKILAQKNKTEAQVFLGDLYMKGVGVYKNFSMAWNWYKRAAERGHAEAQFKLGKMYRDGKGAPIYLEKSTEWLNSAARQGHGEARALLQKLGLKLPPMEMKKPQEMAPGKGQPGDKKVVKKYTAPSFEVLLEGMTPASEEAPAEVVELARQYVKAVNDTDVETLKKLIAPEYAACVNDKNRKVYEDYLLRGVSFKITTPFKAVMGDIDSARLPFKDTVAFPVLPVRYVRLDMTRPAPQPDAEKIKLAPAVIQFLALQDGKWSLTLGCPTAEGIRRMRHFFGRAKNG